MALGLLLVNMCQMFKPYFQIPSESVKYHYVSIKSLCKLENFCQIFPVDNLMLAKVQDFFNMKFLVFYFLLYICRFNLTTDLGICSLNLISNYQKILYIVLLDIYITRYKNVYSIHLQLTPSGSISLIKSMHLIKNPVKTCDTVYSLIQSLTSQIRHRMEDPKSSGKYCFSWVRK